MKLSRHIAYIVLLVVTSVAALAQELPVPRTRNTEEGLTGQRLRFKSEPLINRAMAALSRGEAEEAEKALLELLRVDPESNVAAVSLANLYLAQQRYAEARKYAAGLLRFYPKYWDMQLVAAYAFAGEGRFQEASSLLEELLSEAPASYERLQDARRLEVQALLAVGRHKTAFEHAQELLKDDDTPRTYMVMASCADRLGKLDLALSSYRTAKQGFTNAADRAEATLSEAFVLLRLGRQDEASKVLSGISEDDLLRKQRYLLFACQAQLAQQRGDPDQAELLYKRALAQNVSDVIVLDFVYFLTHYGKTLIADGHRPEGMAKLSQAWELVSKNIPPGALEERRLVLLQSELLSDLELYNEARAACEKSLATNPADNEIRHRLAVICELAGDKKAAIEQFEKLATGTGPEAMRTQAGIAAARLLLSERRPLAAVKILQAMPVASADTEDRDYLQASACFDLGEFTEAIRRFRELCAAHPDNMEYRAQYAHALYGGKQFQQALVQARNVLERKQDESLRFVAAESARELKRYDEALSHYARIVRGSKDTTLVARSTLAAAYMLMDQGREQDARLMLEGMPSDGVPEDLRQKALGFRGTLAGRSGKFEEAEEFFAAAIALGPSREITLARAHNLLRYGRDLLARKQDVAAQGKLTSAWDLLRSTFTVEELDTQANTLLQMDILMALRLEDAAVRRGLNYLEATPNDMLVRRKLAIIYELMGERQLAIAQYRLIIRDDTDVERISAASLAAANLLLAGSQPDDALDFLEAARNTGTRLDFLKGYANYEAGHYEEAVRYLGPLCAENDDACLLAGYAFTKTLPARPGLAWHYFSMVKAPEALTPEEREGYYPTMAYLAFDQNRFEKTIEMTEHALANKNSLDLRILQARAMMRLGRIEAAYEMAKTLDAAADRISDRIRTLDLLGGCQFKFEQFDDAYRTFRLAGDLNPNSMDLLFKEAQCLDRAGKRDEAAELYRELLERADESSPYTYWASAALNDDKRSEYDDAAPLLQRALMPVPVQPLNWSNLGYMDMKRVENDRAEEAFVEAIDQEIDITPFSPEEEQRGRDQNLEAHRYEYTKLKHVVGAELYFAHNNIDQLTLIDPVPPISTADQVPIIPQAGLVLRYRPPIIGYRNERTVDVFGRVLTNLEQDRWRDIEESRQGGVGVEWKPLRWSNYVVSFERLFKIGSASENNWLLRNRASMSLWPQRRAQGKWTREGRIFGDASWYIEDPSRWVYYADVRMAPVRELTESLELAIPQPLVVWQHTDYDKGRADETIWYYGVGLNLIWKEQRQRYTVSRWQLQSYLRYVWGEVEVGNASESFEGPLFGVQFMR